MDNSRLEVLRNLHEFRGSSWSDLNDFAQSIPGLETSETDEEMTVQSHCVNSFTDGGIRHSEFKSSGNVVRLSRTDMDLFGLCPETEPFAAVLCELCGAIVKPQGLEKHMLKKHYSKGMASSSTFTTPIALHLSRVGSSSSGQSNYKLSIKHSAYDRSSSNAAVYGKSLSPAASPGPPSEIYNNKIKIKQHCDTNGKTRLTAVTSSILQSSSVTAGVVPKITEYDEFTSDSTGPLLHSSTVISSSSSSSSSSTSSSSSAPPVSASTNSSKHHSQHHTHHHHHRSSNHQRSKTSSASHLSSNGSGSAKKISSGSSSGSSGNKVIPLKEREYNPDIHCGVQLSDYPDGDKKNICLRSLTCKTHSIALRRNVVGRSKSFDVLLADNRAQKHANNNSINKKQNIKVVPLNSDTLFSGTMKPKQLTNLMHQGDIDMVEPTPPIKVERDIIPTNDVSGDRKDYIINMTNVTVKEEPKDLTNVSSCQIDVDYSNSNGILDDSNNMDIDWEQNDDENILNVCGFKNEKLDIFCPDYEKDLFVVPSNIGKDQILKSKRDSTANSNDMDASISNCSWYQYIPKPLRSPASLYNLIRSNGGCIFKRQLLTLRRINLLQQSYDSQQQQQQQRGDQSNGYNSNVMGGQVQGQRLNRRLIPLSLRNSSRQSHVSGGNQPLERQVASDEGPSTGDKQEKPIIFRGIDLNGLFYKRDVKRSLLTSQSIPSVY